MAVAGSGGWIPSNRVIARAGRLDFIGGYTQNKPRQVVDDLPTALAKLLAGESAQIDVRHEFQSQLRAVLRVKMGQLAADAELSAQLDEVKARRRETERYTDAWAALCVEMGRLTAEIWRVRRETKKIG